MSCNLSLHPRNKHAVAASPLLPQLVHSAQSCHAGEEEEHALALAALCTDASLHARLGAAGVCRALLVLLSRGCKEAR